MLTRNRGGWLLRQSLTLLVLVAALGTATSASAMTLPVGANPASRPPALVQAGPSRTACIYAGLDSTLATAERATGISYRCVETFSDAEPTWADWVSPWVTHAQYGYVGWLAAAPTRRTVILTQNVVPDSAAANPDWRAEGAAGRFDKYARQLAENLVATGFGYSVIRLGHEMNGTWYNDTIGNNATQWRQWAEYFAQIVRTMRAVPGAHFLFDWNVNAGYRDIPLADYYPGNAFVDIVGIDLYDASASGPLPPPSSPYRWLALASEPLGIDDVYAFAVRHHKPLSIPEWGTLSSSGNGDDGSYVAHIGSFVASHDVAYQSWFDAGSDNVLTLSGSDAPRSLAAYVRAFGPGHLRHGSGFPSPPPSATDS